MAKLADLQTGDIVTRPDWNNGRPVRVTRVGNTVRYQDVNAHGHARQAPADDTDVTVKARRRGSA